MSRLSQLGTKWPRHYHSTLGSFSSTISYRSFWSSWSSSDRNNGGSQNNKENSHIIERYRFQQPNSSMINDFRSETERTIQSLDPTVCRQMLDRIHNVVETDLQKTQDEEDTDEAAAAFDGEPGPTGKWLYQFEILENDNNRRIYHRQPVTRSINDNSNRKETTKEVVLELEPTVELLAMSLTPDEDESCVAALVQRHGNFDGTDKMAIVNEIRLRNIKTGVEKRIRMPTKESNPIAETVTSLEWGPDVFFADNDVNYDISYPHHTIFFLHTNHQGQPNCVLLARINPGTMDLINDELPKTIFRTDDPKVMVSMQRTKGSKYISIEASTKTSNEIYLSNGNPSSPLQLVKSREQDVMYHVDVGPVVNNEEQQEEETVVTLVGDDHLYEVLVSSLPVTDLNTTKPYVSSKETNEHSISDIDIFRHHIVLYECSRRTGDQRIRIINREGGDSDTVSNSYIVDLPSPKILPWAKISPFGNINYNSTTLTFRLESPVDPGIEYELDFETSKVSPLRQSPHPADYSYEKVFVKSQDGTDIPLSIYKHCNIGESTEDVLLACYGAYGEPIGYEYNPVWKALLDIGLVVAFAHTRGGNELGPDWHHAATKEKKTKGIDDLEACARYLKSRFSQRNLSAYAFSAGGILVGATVNRHPGLFDKVILINSYLDVLATMKNPSLFLTEHEYDEFGDPSNDEIIERAISSYCPISNLIPIDQRRSNTKFFIIGTLKDANVPYWNSVIYFQKLLEGNNGNSSNSSDGDIDQSRPLFFINFDGGHHFDGRHYLELHSYIMAFLMNMTVKKDPS